MALDDFQDILGQVIGVLAGIESIRKPGGIGDYFGNRLAVATDPDKIAGLTGRPLLSGFYGVPGNVQPTYGDVAGRPYQRVYDPSGTVTYSDPWGTSGGLAMPSNPEPQPIWTPQVAAVGPDAFLKRQLAQAQLAGLQQENRNLIDFSDPNALKKLMESQDLVPGGMEFDEKGRPRWKLAPRPYRAPPAGATRPGTDQPYTPGEPLPGPYAPRALPTPPGKAATNAAKMGADLARLRGGKEAFLATFGPTDQGDPLDLLPEAKTQFASGWLRQNPVTGFFTSAGEGPGFIPGGEISIPRRAREGDPAALALTRGSVVRSEVARGFGGLGNLAVEEQEVVENVLPNKEDTRELGIAKRDFLTRVFDAVEAGLRTGQFANEDDARKAFLDGLRQFQPGATPNLSQVTPSTEGTPSSVTTPAPSPFDPKQLDEDAKHFGGQ